MKHFNLLIILLFIAACHSATGPEFGGLNDIDGNEYVTVKIGDQWWMAENLKVSRYRNGDEIPNITEDTEWSEMESGAWAFYNNDPEVNDEFGKLYNWYAANDERDICPEGWMVPGESDWEKLINHLGGRDKAGGAMKDTTLWLSPNEGASNESGFTGLPAGLRVGSGGFDLLGRTGFWWYRGEPVRARDLNFLRESAGITHQNDKTRGYSIRCVRE